jgi:hypothetical protein
MIKLDFHTNFDREGGEINPANGRGLRTIKVGTGPNNMLFIFIYLYCFFTMIYDERGGFSGSVDHRENCSILFEAALIFKKLYFEVTGYWFL